jgi:hypothetical protein
MSAALNSYSNQFIFSLPTTFVPQDIEKKYKGLLERIRSPYMSVIDYINSAIVSINFPGLTFETSEQTGWKGKKVNYRGAKTPYDGYNRSVNITFKSVNNQNIYFIVQECIMWHYINTNDHFADPLMIIVLDKHREEVYRITFTDILFTGISETNFEFKDVAQDLSTFTVPVVFNFLDISYINPENVPYLIKTKL